LPHKILTWFLAPAMRRTPWTRAVSPEADRVLEPASRLKIAGSGVRDPLRYRRHRRECFPPGTAALALRPSRKGWV